MQDDDRTIDDLRRNLSDRQWRLRNLYCIRDANGRKVRFRPNRVQSSFLKNLWYFNVILKARQLGFSTLILIYLLDACLFSKNHSAGVIAQGMNEATDLFENKIKFAYNALPQLIKDMVPATQDSARKMSFGNGSSIIVGTSLRGGTYQKLLVSEYGKISARYPEKAKEIKTGAFNTVHAGQQIFVESTAEGQEGEFYELSNLAQNLRDSSAVLSPLDPRFHFYPWYEEPSYCLNGDALIATVVTSDMAKYFKDVEKITGVDLTDGQKAWYCKKANLMREDMKREFPSYPEEAFEAAVDGCYYAIEMSEARRKGRITSVPYDPSCPVHTFWDLGVSDMTTIWFIQKVGMEFRAIDYYEHNTAGIQHYADMLKDREYRYGTHYWPHDGANFQLATGKTLDKTAKEHGIKPIVIVPRTNDLKNDRQKVRNILPLCWFDETRCTTGIKHLSSYRREWDTDLGVWKDVARHDMASHGADGFRTFAVGFRDQVIVSEGNYEDDAPASFMDW